MPGADEDAARIAAFIRANLDRITAIHVTLDTHQVGLSLNQIKTRLGRCSLLYILSITTPICIQRMHISHGVFWRGPYGAPPPPFTVITHADAQGGKWTPVNPEQRVREYALVCHEILNRGFVYLN